MAYDEELAVRIRDLLSDERGVTEQRMFGGLAFLVRGNMAVAASGQGGVLVRVDPAESDRLVATTGAEPMEMRGRSIRGWLRVEAADVRTKRQLGTWVRRGVGYARSCHRRPGVDEARGRGAAFRSSLPTRRCLAGDLRRVRGPKSFVDGPMATRRIQSASAASVAPSNASRLSCPTARTSSAFHGRMTRPKHAIETPETRNSGTCRNRCRSSRARRSRRVGVGLRAAVFRPSGQRRGRQCGIS